MSEATFAHAMSRMSDMAASVASRLGLTSPTRNARTDRIEGFRVLSHCGVGYSKLALSNPASACNGPSMCSIEWPLATRPTRVYLPDRFSGFIGAVVQICVVGLGNQNPGGITPTTVRAVPPRRRGLPTMAGSAPRSRHSE